MLESDPGMVIKGDLTVKDLINKKLIKLGTSLSLLTSGAALAQGGVREGIDFAQTDEQPAELTDIIENIVRVLLFVVGVAAVIMLIIGGIRYVVSSGDQTAVANAKNTILYAIVGVIVAVLSWAAVDYVFGLVSNET